ncbi:hypothetical protein ALC53_01115 [Atta colombica]|uniref:Uncharacterized protein n=1 Tax=Atta colombica TaxID=520822 RepID=A0A151I5V7_9HYME|nr:hypothetical protein ALC53_01115 [Atta colombica]
MKYKNRLLRERINNDKYKVTLKKLFTDNQIQVLFAKKSNAKCSNDTIQRALKLKLTCGTTKNFFSKEFPSFRILKFSTMLGNITFPNDKGIATHLLTFMITGIASRWKKNVISDCLQLKNNLKTYRYSIYT